MEPLKLIAPLKDYLWGGRRLKDEFGKQTDLDPVAESWELSCHKDGSSVIANRKFAGMSLPEWIARQGRETLGTDCAGFAEFPTLIKLIDAKQNLSVQVHPDNGYALRVEGEYGKTEMWYIVACEPGARLLYGFQRPLDRAEFRRRIEENTLLEVTNSVEVHPGDVFFIEAGTLHAIGAGILIAEIQQNSNITYRVYDYGRVGKDGKPRQLHVEKALEVTRLEPPTRPCGPEGEPVERDGYTETLLASCAYFTTRRLCVAWEARLEVDSRSFHSLLCLSGELRLESQNGSMEIAKGDSVFLQASFGEYRLVGAGELLLTTV